MRHDGTRARVAGVSGEVPILAVSGLTGEGMDGLVDALPAGTTAVLLGSSGAGKSTLVNRLLGEERIVTQAIRDSDDRGRCGAQHVATSDEATQR